MAEPLQAPDPGVLFVSYHFPPSAAVGGQRSANFASGLSSLGWTPHVLTIADTDVEDKDPVRVSGLGGVEIHKAPVLPILVKRWMAFKQGRTRGPLRADEQGRASISRPDREGLSTRLRRYLLSFLVLPDMERGWIIPAVMSAARLIRRRRLQWIVTSCPPYSVHLIGLALKMMTGVRWAVDFRDPWMTTGSKRLYPTCALSLRIESWLEKQVIKRSDVVIFNVDRLRLAYRAKYSRIPPDKFAFIPNGIARTAGAGPVAKYERFTICYTGSLYVGRSPEPIFKAVAALVQEGRVGAADLCIKLVGHCRRIDGVPTQDVVVRYGLESVVEVSDPVPYDEAFEMVRRSHLALLLAPSLPYQIPAKVYDYLGAGTRILAIAEEGATTDLLRETASGRAFGAEETQAIATFIERERAFRSQPTSPASLHRYDVTHISAELAGHLDRVGRARR